MREDCNINTSALYEKVLSENIDWKDWPDWISQQIITFTHKY